MTSEPRLKRDSSIHPVYLVGFAGLMAGLSGLTVTLVSRRWTASSPPLETAVAVQSDLVSPVVPAAAAAMRVQQSRKPWRVLALTALLLGGASLALIPGPAEYLLPGVLALVLGIWGLRRVMRASPQSWPQSDVMPAAAVCVTAWAPLIAGIIALVLVTARSMLTPLPPVLAGLTIHVQVALLAAGIVLVAWGLAGRRVRMSVERGWRARLLDALPIIAVTGLALLVRAWDLENALRLMVDELSFSNALLFIEAQSDIRLLEPFHHIIRFPWTYPYLQYLGANLVGHNFAGLRLASVILGALTVPGLYVLARALFDRPTALLAALLLAVFPPHVHFSRLGINNIADPLFGVWALALAARGLRGGGRADWALAGVMLGLSQYWYEGGRLLYPALMLVWLGGDIGEAAVDWGGIVA